MQMGKRGKGVKKSEIAADVIYESPLCIRKEVDELYPSVCLRIESHEVLVTFIALLANCLAHQTRRHKSRRLQTSNPPSVASMVQINGKLSQCKKKYRVTHQIVS